MKLCIPAPTLPGKSIVFAVPSTLASHCMGDSSLCLCDQHMHCGHVVSVCSSGLPDISRAFAGPSTLASHCLCGSSFCLCDQHMHCGHAVSA